jgi:hypothetical protein
VSRVEHLAGSMAIAVVLVAVGQSVDQVQASKPVWILEAEALPAWQTAAELVGVRLEVGMEGNVAAAECEFLRPHDLHRHLVRRLRSDPYYQIALQFDLWHDFQA